MPSCASSVSTSGAARTSCAVGRSLSARRSALNPALSSGLSGKLSARMKSLRSSGGTMSSAWVPRGSTTWPDAVSGGGGAGGTGRGGSGVRTEEKVASAVSVLRWAATISSSFCATVLSTVEPSDRSCASQASRMESMEARRRALSSRTVRLARAVVTPSHSIATGMNTAISTMTKSSACPAAPGPGASAMNQSAAPPSHATESTAAMISTVVSRPRDGVVERGAGSFDGAMGRAFASDIGHLDHLVGTLAARRADLDAVALLLADEGAGDRRFHVEQALLDIGLVLAHDLPGVPGLGVLVDQRHGGAELDRARQARGVDHLGEAEDALDLLEATLDEGLLLLGGMILGILAEIAMLARLGDGADDGGALDRLEVLELLFQRFVTGGCHRYLFHRARP